ncbi:GFA family protein [Marinobacterium rhizophilum]|uniref:GFA family protein n=1 Tax=Marinobacterium rhizophilum TaxID=420402 RepID=A0ABY5HK19_9GAMM|nr:GFA family protein [Marinobacterium rhizophilum]UTW11612.1 GFA family protein [Marinobacterium rhizophilum]
MPSNLFCKPEQLHWLGGEDRVQRFRLQGAARFGRSFCRACGSPVAHGSDDGRYVLVPAGSLDDAPGLLPQARIFCASRADWDAGITDAVPSFDSYPT